MALRAVISPDTIVRPSARVKTVAQMLDCDESQVRRMVAAGTLKSYRLGKRGIRIYLDSVADFQHPQAKPRPTKQESSQAGRRAHLHAMAELRARGIV